MIERESGPVGVCQTETSWDLLGPMNRAGLVAPRAGLLRETLLDDFEINTVVSGSNHRTIFDESYYLAGAVARAAADMRLGNCSVNHSIEVSDIPRLCPVQYSFVELSPILISAIVSEAQGKRPCSRLVFSEELNSLLADETAISGFRPVKFRFADGAEASTIVCLADLEKYQFRHINIANWRKMQECGLAFINFAWNEIEGFAEVFRRGGELQSTAIQLAFARAFDNLAHDLQQTVQKRIQ